MWKAFRAYMHKIGQDIMRGLVSGLKEGIKKSERDY